MIWGLLQNSFEKIMYFLWKEKKILKFQICNHSVVLLFALTFIFFHSSFFVVCLVYASLFLPGHVVLVD